MMTQLKIHGLGSDGEGVGSADGYTLFIDGALPGETVTARILEQKKRYGRGKLLSIDTPSPDRVKPICPHFGKCGGCQLMHLSYPKQLEMKRQRVIDALTRIGKLENFLVEPCIPSPKETHYRNKIQLPARLVDGKLKFGLYEKNSHDLVPIDGCHIHSSLGESVYQKIAPILQKSKLQLRHLLIKSTLRTEEALVLLVTDGEISPLLREIADEIMAASPLIKGVIHNRHTGASNVILGKVYTTLKGAGSISERLSGLTFKVSPASFFQVNPAQAEALYGKALEFANLQGNETVLDAYCGVGTLSLLFAKQAGKVIGVESVPEAIEDALENGRINQIQNAEFILGRSEEWIKTSPPIDLVLLNPPRKGADPAFLEGIGKLSPKTLIYISCDMATLARDLNLLKIMGYRIEKVQPFDMFPQTAHVECVVLLRFGDLGDKLR